MIKFIGHWFQKRREERMRLVNAAKAKEDAQRRFDQYKRDKRVIMPQRDPRDWQRHWEEQERPAILRRQAF